MRRIASLTLTIALLAAACGDSDSDEGTETATSDAAPEVSEATQTTAAADDGVAGQAADYASTVGEPGKPTITLAETNPGPPGALLVEDVITTDGRAVNAGDVVEVHYVGITLSTGVQFDASWDRGQSFFSPIGVGNLIPGWDIGIVGMTEGSRRLLVIPSDMAYGDRGAGPDIGPGETLVFVVDLLQVVDSTPPEIPDISDPPTELEIIDVTVGDGELVEAGDVISVHYQGNLLDGTLFDSSWGRGSPFTTAIGVGQVIQGWDEGMVGMREGGRRILVIPSEMAYGETGSGGTIGPNTPLVFVVDLLRVHG